MNFYNPFLIIIFGIAIFLFVFVLLLLLFTLGYRIYLISEEKHREKFVRIWRPLIIQSIDKIPETFPKLSRRDIYPLLMLWNYYHESLRGDSETKLNDFALAVGIDRYAEEMLKSASREERFIAIATMGHLRNKAAWDTLKQFVVEGDSYSSLMAMRAMVLIDPALGMPLFMSMIGQRGDWSPAKTAIFLKDSGADTIGKPLADAIQNAKGENLRHLLGYLKLTHLDVALPVLRELVQTSEDEEIVSLCVEHLGVLRHPEDLKLIRIAAKNAKPKIRAYAAEALGKMGTAEDCDLLIGLLNDSNYWVRYEAAKALSSLPFMDSQKLSGILKDQVDPFAKDMLSQELTRSKLT